MVTPFGRGRAHPDQRLIRLTGLSRAALAAIIHRRPTFPESQMPSIDVVVPCRQYGRYLRACVESVLSQNVEALRVLIVDNASTDDSLAVATALAREDSRVEILARDRDLGPHASFNAGVDWARAEFFAIVCADDVLAPGAFARACRFMTDNPTVAFTHGEAWPIGRDDPAPAATPGAESDPGKWRLMRGRDFIRRFCGSGYFRIAGSSIVVRTAIQKRAGHYRPALVHSDDYEMWLRLGMLGDIGETSATQGYLRLHGENRTTQLSRGHGWEFAEVKGAIDSFFAHEGAALGDAQALHRRAVRSLAARAYWAALANVARGRTDAFPGFFAAATALSPAMRLVPPIDYLVTRPDALSRIGASLGEAARRLGRPRREGAAC